METRRRPYIVYIGDRCEVKYYKGEVLITLVSRDGGSGYRTYVFKESTRRYAIDRKGRGRKEVIYLRVADVSCTRSVRKSIGLSYRGPYGGVP